MHSDALFTNCNTLNARIISWKVYDHFFTLFGVKPHIILASPYINHIDRFLDLWSVTFFAYLKYCTIINILIYWSCCCQVIYEHYKVARAWYSALGDTTFVVTNGWHIFPILTCCVLFRRKLAVHLNIWGGTSFAWSFTSNFSWLIRSNALAKSSKTILT